MPKLTLCADSCPREDLAIPVLLHTREESPFGDGTTAEHYLARSTRFKHFPHGNALLLSSRAGFALVRPVAVAQIMQIRESVESA